ncbi:MAG: hypothetical protein GY811_04530 [Myxococcales bacterium]|nr:hypothetical protein [Myxococcales bacterium]
MSLTTPTTAEISDNIITQLEASLGQSIPLLPKSFLRVLAKALAAVFVILYKYAGFMFLQMFVQSASAKETEVNGVTLIPLVQLGRLVGTGDPVGATSAELLIDISVESQTGTLPAGTQLVNANNGVTYLTIAAVALDADTVQTTIRAYSDQTGGGGEGTIGNLDAGDTVSFANPLANVNRTATVDSQTTTGADAEATDVYRQRILDRFQKRPQGGAYADYEQWGEEVAGILNVYPYTGDPGQVDLYSDATVASSGSADGIPTEAQLLEVKASCELDQDGRATRRPVNVFINSYPITRTGFEVVVDGVAATNLADVQASISAAVTEYFYEREPYIIGLALPPRRDRITQGAIAGIVDDIVSAAEGTFSAVTITEGAVPLTTRDLGTGEKAKADSIGYT